MEEADPMDERIKEAGVSEVMRWLRDRGWSPLSGMMNEGGPSDRIEACRNDETILFTVRSSIYPIDPGFLTSEERDSYKTLAQNLNVKPKLARVWLSEDLKLKDDVVMWCEI